MTKIKKVFRTIAGDRQLLFGCLGLMILLLVILFQGVLETHDPYEYGSDSLVGLGVNGHLLGTNKLGQDIFSMLIAGVSTSLKVALISSMISAIIGILIGGAAGFLGGKVDLVLSELINVFMMIPTFFLELMIIALFGNSIVNVMIVIGLTSWASNAKLMRAQALPSESAPSSKARSSWARASRRFCSTTSSPTASSRSLPTRRWACPARF